MSLLVFGSGSLNVLRGTATASYAISSSFANTASYALNSNSTVVNNSFTSSYLLTSSFNSVTSSLTVLSSSYAATASLLLGTIASSSYSITSSYAISASNVLYSISSSYASNANVAANVISASYSLNSSTASYAVAYLLTSSYKIDSASFSASIANFTSTGNLSSYLLTSSFAAFTSSLPNSVLINEFNKQITQTSHGFVVGNVLRYDPISYWTLALADSANDAQVIGIVSSIIDSNNFVLNYGGYVSGSGFTSSLTQPGNTYYLSDTINGGLSTVVPSTPGHVMFPVIYCDNTGSGYIIKSIGFTITNSSSYSADSASFSASIASLNNSTSSITASYFNSYANNINPNLLFAYTSSILSNYVGSYVIWVGGNGTITIPSASAASVIDIKNAGSGSLIISASYGNTIENSSAIMIIAASSSVHMVSNLINSWYIF